MNVLLLRSRGCIATCGPLSGPPCAPCGVCQALLDMLELYYWHTPAAASFGRQPLLHKLSGETIGQRPNEDAVKQLRARVLKLLHVLATSQLTRADVQV